MAVVFHIVEDQMATQIRSSSSSTVNDPNYTNVNLGISDSLIVLANVSIYGNDIWGVNGDGSRHIATIQGTVVGTHTGIGLGDSVINDFGNVVRISSSGTVIGTNSYGVGLSGYNSALYNDGTVFGGIFGAQIYGQGGTGRISNTGSIQGSGAGIYGAGTQILEIINSGVISGPKSIDISNEVVSARITNTGHLDGDVEMGDGNGTYNGVSGHVVGAIRGEGGVDTITTGIDADVIDGGTGGDRMAGGYGDDWYYVDNKSDVIVEAVGRGFDIVLASSDYTLSTGAEVENLSSGNGFGAASLDLTGNEFGQYIYGDAGANTLSGVGGVDTMFGLDGNDIIRGGVGNDILDGGVGAGDTADYTDKTLKVQVTLNGATGVKVLVNGVAEDTIKNFERVFGGSSDDVFTGDAQSNLFQGGAGADRLSGLGGNDTLRGGLGIDTLDGGLNFDTADYADKTTSVVIALNGATAVRASIGGTLEDALKNIENLIGGIGADKFTGDSLANTLNGGAGNDVLSGGAGKDLLVGGTGKNTLTGGADADSFRFIHPYDTIVTKRGVPELQTITDFSHADDKIQFESATVAAETAVAQTNFKSNASGHAGDADDNFIYDRSNGQLWYDADAGGATYAARLVAQFGTTASHPLNLDYTDFFAI